MPDPVLGAEHRANNFDALRLLAASLVVVAHGYALTGKPGLWASHGVDFGLIGVTTFFAISGYLVTASWRSQPRIYPFVAKRLLRIMPALVVIVLVIAYLMGPLVTALTAGSYLSDWQTHSWVIHNVLFDPVYQLPGVFTDHVNTAANGSLWSLAVEIRAYGLVMLCGLLGLFAGWRIVLLIAIGVAFAVLSLPSFWATPDPLLGPAAQNTIRDVVGAGPSGTSVMIAFVAGMLIQTQRRRLRLHPLAGGLAAALFLASYWLSPGARTVLLPLALTYLVLFLAYETPPLPWLTRWGDASYAIYLLAFPVEQLTIGALGDSAAPGAVIAISLPICWALALVSWRLVEAPMLKLKKRLPRSGRQPSSTTASTSTDMSKGSSAAPIAERA
jgi:peptidoglycan/LPS O-acetylase OafA/YrhL